MKLSRLVRASSLLVAGVAHLLSAAPTGEDLGLIIASPDVVIRESNVVLQVTMTNRTSRPMTLIKSNPGCDFYAEVRDLDKRIVPPTTVGAELSHCANRVAFGRRIRVTLAPGESTDETYPIDLYYGLARQGSTRSSCRVSSLRIRAVWRAQTKSC